MTDLKLSGNTTPPSGFPNPEVSSEKPAKKKSGCGCFFAGCFALLLLATLPFVGVGIWFATLTEADLGNFAISVVTNDAFADGFKEAIQESKEMNADEKAALISLYDSLLKNYHGLPPEKQELINKNIVIIFKKALENPEAFEQAPPPELLEIMTLLGFDPNSLSGMPTSTNPTPTNTPTTTTPPTGDAYDFDLPTTPQNPTEDTNQNPTQFDF